MNIRIIFFKSNQRKDFHELVGKMYVIPHISSLVLANRGWHILVSVAQFRVGHPRYNELKTHCLPSPARSTHLSNNVPQITRLHSEYFEGERQKEQWQ